MPRTSAMTISDAISMNAMAMAATIDKLHWHDKKTNGMMMVMIAVCGKCTTIKTKWRTSLAANSINNTDTDKKQSKRTTQHKRTKTKKHDRMQQKCDQYTTIHIKIG